MFAKLDYYSSLKNELQLLAFTRDFLESKRRFKVALANSDVPALRKALTVLQRQPDFTMVRK